MRIWLLILCAAVPALATEPPIEISAQHGISIDDVKKEIIATEKVKIKKAQSVGHGEHGTALYENKEGKRTLTYVTLKERVYLESPEGAAWGDLVVYDIPKDRMILTGTKLKIQSDKGSVTARDALLYYPDAKKAEALGNVHVFHFDPVQHLFAQKVVVFFKEVPSQKMEGVSLKSLEAHDKVKVVLPQRIGTADHAFYDGDKDEITLKGNVTLVMDNKELKGEYAILDRKTGYAKVWGEDPGITPTVKPKRVRILMLPKKKETP